VNGNRTKKTAALVAALGLAGVSLGAAAGAPSGPNDPSLAGFPPGYIQDCATRPATAVTVVPAPFNAYMRVVCTKVSDALAPIPGFEWLFPNNTTGFIAALNPKLAPTAEPAHFTRLTVAPLTPAEVAAFRQRLNTVAKDPEILKADVMRLEVDTSTSDHKQEYLMISHTPNLSPNAWGIECYNDCTPLEASPWAWIIAPVPTK
jgi:hypothetical protein